MDTNVAVLFWHYTYDEPTEVQEKLADSEVGPYLFFRRSKSAIQERLAQLFPHQQVPKVFLHGSPHIDNYVKTQSGYGIVDFDRAYIGPYCWDIVCAMLAIHFRNPELHYSALPEVISQTFSQYYLQHLQHPDLPYQPYEPLEAIKPKKWELDIAQYVEGKHKWAKKLEHQQLPTDDVLANAIFQQYLHNLDDASVLAHYQIANISRAEGSFGRRRYLLLLTPTVPDYDPIFIDIKETRDYLALPWPHNQWYSSPCEYQGQRMIKAAKLYAPSCVQLESFACINGIEYWGRQVPILNRKPDKVFSLADQIAFAKAAGSQLGRGHSLAVQDTSVANLEKHFNQSFDKLIEITQKMQRELMAVWKQCIKVQDNA